MRAGAQGTKQSLLLFTAVGCNLHRSVYPPAGAGHGTCRNMMLNGRLSNVAMLQSEGVLVGNRRSLLERSDLLPVVHELLERLEAHLVAEGYYSVVCNMRGTDPKAIAASMRDAGLGGLQGPTISQVPLCHDLELAVSILGCSCTGTRPPVRYLVGVKGSHAWLFLTHSSHSCIRVASYSRQWCCLWCNGCGGKSSVLQSNYACCDHYCRIVGKCPSHQAELADASIHNPMVPAMRPVQRATPATTYLPLMSTCACKRTVRPSHALARGCTPIAGVSASVRQGRHCIYAMSHIYMCDTSERPNAPPY